ncbi:MAG: hypothetical protein ACJ704_05950 [Nitrososphaeraceae archaeon]
MMFKDLKQLVSQTQQHRQQQQILLFERLRNKPFWIWNIESI